MSDLNSWDTTDANNNSAAPDGWPENTMQYSEVNDAGRAVMGAMARFFNDVNGSLAAGGLVNAYTLTLNAPYSAYSDGLMFACTIPITNTSTTVTLNVNAIGTVSVKDAAGDNPAVGSLVAGTLYQFYHDGTNLRFANLVGGVSSVNGANGTVVLDPDDLDDTSTTNKFTTAAEISKLAGIESAATADQTDAEIRAAVEAATDSNVFTDADHTKLNGIAAGAEVNPDVVSQAEAEAGTATTERIWTALRVAQAIAALESSPPAAVTGHVRAGNTQLVNGRLSLSRYANINALVAAGSWETMGPTGSGADNTWADMDNLPSSATILIVDVLVELTPTATGNYVRLYCAEDSSAPSALDEDNMVISHSADDTAEDTKPLTRLEIPLNSTDQTFQFAWNSSSALSQAIHLYYRGFKTD